MKTQTCNRRSFLKQTACLAGGISVFPAWSRAADGANSEIRLAIIGLGNKGKHHVQLFFRQARRLARGTHRAPFVLPT